MAQPPVQTLPAPVPLKYQRDTKRLYSRGVDFNDPVDSIKDGYYPILENLRSYTDGILQPRQGITQVNAGVITSQTPVHSARRLNNKLNNTFTRVVGTGTKLAVIPASNVSANVQYSAVDVAFSGNPLAMVPWRPDQSPVSWMYVADSTNMYKLTYNGSVVTTHKIGIASPTTAPTVELATPKITGVGPPFVLGGFFGAGSVGNWTNTAIAGAVTNGNRVTGVTVTAILYDSGTTGWCSIVPSTMTNLGPGTILNTLTGIGTEYTMLWESYRASSPASNTVATIIYDNKPTNTGACTIVPSGSVIEIRRNCVVRLNGGTKYFRVTEVITGPDSSVIAFKCNTGATLIAAGQTLEVVSSFRTFSNTTLDTTTLIQSDTIKSTWTIAGANTLGSITYTPPAPVDMTFVILGTNAISDQDYYHFGFKVADISQIVQARLMFDVSDSSFLNNYFYRAVTASDLVAAAKATQTALTVRATQVQNRIISGPFEPLAIIPINKGGLVHRDSADRQTVAGSSSTFSDNSGASADNFKDGGPREQTGTGDSQWSEIRFRRGDCVRVGTDWSKGWHSVQAVRLEVTLIAANTVPQVVEISSFNVWGSASPDIGDVGAPFLFRYRYRSSTTGVVSNWSPATRSGLIALRNKISLSGTASAAPEVDLIDWQRWGGLVLGWADIGTATNASAGSFTDTVDDDFARSTLVDAVGNVNFQPWPSAQSPLTGTTGTVAGTMIVDSGTSFNTSWLNGTGIKVNGISTTIRRVISTSLLEVDDCVGTGTGFTWEIPEPFIRANLPCLWGGGNTNGWFFACGDTTNPGRLYFSNQNDPDTTGDQFFIDVTGPSEPLQNGFTFNSRPYVFSSEKLYEIVEIASGAFVARETPTGKGLMYRWAFCVGPRVWFQSKDGIYETDGGYSRSLTFAQLYPLFPHDGILGTAVNNFQPPNMVSGNLTVSGITADASTFFRMWYQDAYLQFAYPDTANQMRVLSYSLGSLSMAADAPQDGWYPDVYNPGGANTGILFGYSEEGDSVHSLLLGGLDTTTGKLYTYGGATDNGTAVSWHVRQASWDAGDRRSDKVWMDFIVDADPGSGGTINVAAGINNYASTPTIASPAGTTTMTGLGRVQTVFDINTGNGVEARNLAIDLSGTGTVARLYLVEPSWGLRVENSYLRAIQYDDAGYEGEKFFQGIEIEADTQNVARSIRIESDAGVFQEALTVQHNGRVQKPYSFTNAFVAHLARMIPTSTDHNLWKLFRWRWIYEPEPPLATVWESQQTSHGHVGFIHLKAIWITHTSTADLTLTITRMDDNTSQSYTVPHSNGVRGLESYLLLGPASFLKGKTFRYKITQAANTPFRLYQRLTGVLVKPWGSAQAFARWVGWGGDSGDGVSQI